MSVGSLKRSPGAAIGAVLSPFKGGMNNVGEGATIDDSQVVLLQNFDVDTDGTLVNRPPIELESQSPSGAILSTNSWFDPEHSATANYSATYTDISNAVLSQLTGQSTPIAYVSTAIRATATGTSGTGTVDIRRTQSNLSANSTYSFSVYVRTNATTASGLRLLVIWQDVNGNAIGGTVSIGSVPAPGDATTWTRLTFDGVDSPNGADRAVVVTRMSNITTSGQWMDATAGMLIDSDSTPEYYDGNTPNTTTDIYQWLSTANQRSRRIDAAAPNSIQALGYYQRNDGTNFLVAVINRATWIYSLTTKAWQQIWGRAASDMCQYDNKIVLSCETAAGGYWEGNNFTTMKSMPKASQIVLYNERFWCFGPKGSDTATTVYFSNITGISPATSIYTWSTSTDFFVVDKGDGQWITAIVADPNALLIFRNQSTYQFTYPNAPINGSLTLINPAVGVDHRYAIVRYENYYWVLNQGNLYQFISYQFYARNVSVMRLLPGISSVQFPSAIGVLGDRILIWYYGALYCFNVRQQTWSTWVSTFSPGRFLQMPAAFQGAGGARQALVFTGGSVAANNNVYRITDSPSGGAAGAGEAMDCTVRTKTYDFTTAGIFKRMTYWAIGFRSAQGVSGVAVPVGVNASAVTFDDMEGYTFDQLDRGSWDAPIIVIPTFADNITFPASAPVQALAKAKAAFRFLSIYFEATLKTTGTPATAPARVFSLTAYLKEHAKTGEKVS